MKTLNRIVLAAAIALAWMILSDLEAQDRERREFCASAGGELIGNTCRVSTTEVAP